MGTLSNTVQAELLDHVFTTGAWTVRSNLYIALSKSTLTAAITGTIAGELSDGAYRRVTCNTWDAAAGTPGATENTQPCTFPQATADWGVVTYFAVVDAKTAATGTVIGWGALTVTKNVQSGDTARFATGDIDVTLT